MVLTGTLVQVHSPGVTGVEQTLQVFLQEVFMKSL
jgi:hypothetical protein